jgi:hypothetical protein
MVLLAGFLITQAFIHNVKFMLDIKGPVARNYALMHPSYGAELIAQLVTMKIVRVAAFGNREGVITGFFRGAYTCVPSVDNWRNIGQLLD